MTKRRNPITLTTDQAIDAIDRGDIKLANLDNEDLRDLIDVLQARIHEKREGVCVQGVGDLLVHTVRAHLKDGDEVAARAWASLVLDHGVATRGI